MFHIGDIELFLFNDAATWIDPGGMFGLVPRVLWSRYCEADERNLVRTANHNLLILAAGRSILVDTGFGNCLSETQRRRAVTSPSATARRLAWRCWASLRMTLTSC